MIVIDKDYLFVSLFFDFVRYFIIYNKWGNLDFVNKFNNMML